MVLSRESFYRMRLGRTSSALLWGSEFTGDLRLWALTDALMCERSARGSASVKSLSWRHTVWVQSVIGAIDFSQSSSVNTDGSIISSPRPKRPSDKDPFRALHKRIQISAGVTGVGAVMMRFVIILRHWKSLSLKWFIVIVSVSSLKPSGTRTCFASSVIVKLSDESKLL